MYIFSHGSEDVRKSRQGLDLHQADEAAQGGDVQLWAQPVSRHRQGCAAGVAASAAVGVADIVAEDSPEGNSLPHMVESLSTLRYFPNDFFFFLH